MKTVIELEKINKAVNSRTLGTYSNHYVEKLAKVGRMFHGGVQICRGNSPLITVIALPCLVVYKK